MTSERPVVVTVSDFPSSGSRLTSQEIVALCREADDAGIERFTISDFPYHRDLVPLMTACLGATSEITLESCVTSPHYRLPETTACTFATMAELSGFRVVLGLGRGGIPLNIPPWGLGRPPALRAMEEMIAVCRALWSGETSPATEVIPTSGMALSFPVDGQIPILVAAGGRQMLALGARLADIVHIASPFLGRDYLGEVIEHIANEAAAAARAPDGYEVDLTVPVSILPDGRRAKQLAKVTAAMGVSWMSERARRAPAGAPLPPEFTPAVHLIEPITAGWRALGDAPFPDELGVLIDEGVLDLFSIAGDPTECQDKLVDLVRALPGATGVRVKLPSLTGDDAAATYAAMIRELGGIAPVVRAARQPVTRS